MNNKTNLLIDLSIFATFLVLMEPKMTGEPFHEWVSLAIAATIVVHLLLHWKWIAGVTMNFFKNFFHESRLKLVIDFGLFIAFTTLMVSGIMISESVLPAFGIQLSPISTWRGLHSASANFTMLLVALHFALNWNWVAKMSRRYLIDPVLGIFKRKTLTAVSVQSNETK